MTMGRKGLVATAVALAGIGLLYGCVSTRLPNIGLQVTGEAARPAVLAPFGGDPAVATVQEWTERRAPLLREAFQTNIYGRFPDLRTATVASRQTLDAPALAGVGVMEQWDVALPGLPDGRGFSMVVVVPAGAQGPVPVIVMENFCGNKSVYPDVAGIQGPRNGSPAECSNSLMRPVVSMIFGNAVLTPPTADILNAGYALAMLYGGDVVPDDAATAEPFLQELTPAGTPPEQRTGAVAAWAWTYLRALDVLALDPRFDPQRMALWGHSRNGKAALLAAAFDPRPAAVIALQAGTAGGSLGHDAVGEGIAEITSTYPHWFAPAFARYAGRQAELPVDQHQLLGLIAPRPVLLAGARRDQWSDPIGAVRAAAGASPVYELFGIAAFGQSDPRTGDFSRPLATYMRPGLHGVHKSDWREIIAFLDAQMPARP
jgi:hypothetical protein